MRLWTAIFALLFSSSILAQTPGFEQVYRTQHFGIEQGLSETHVLSIAEDDFGFIWVGTINGLNRFDGRKFKQYLKDDSNEHGLSASTIYDIVTIPNGSMWIVTDYGIYNYQSKEDYFNLLKEIPYNKILSYTTHNGRLLILTDKNILSLDKKESKTLSNNKYKDRKLLSLKGNIFTLSNDQVLYDLNENIVDSYNFTDLRKKVSVKNKNNSVIINDFNIESISKVQKHKNKYYILSGKEIYKINLYEETKSKIGDFKTNDFVVSETGNLWYIAPYKGIARIRNIDSEVKLFTSDEKSTKSIWSFANYLGNILYSDRTEYLKVLNSNLKPLNTINVGVSGPKTICVDNSNVYIGGKGGLFLFDGSKTNKIYGDKDTIVTTISTCNEGLTFGTISGEVLKFDTNKKSIISLYSIDRESPIFKIHHLNGKLYIGSQSGLLEEHNENAKIILPNDIVTSIDSINDNLYIGTLNGLYKLANNNSEKLLSESIYSAEKVDNLLILSSKGKILIYDTSSENIINAIAVSGGAQKEYNGMASLNSTNENLYFAGVDGINSIENIKSLYKNDVQNISPFINKFKLFNKELKFVGWEKEPAYIAKKIQLKHSDYPFSIELGDFSGLAENEKKYEYRLLGSSEKWIELDGINSITFTNLPYGKYTLEYKLVSKNTKFESETNQLEIYISPPPWLSHYAKIIYIVILFLLIIFLIKEFNRRKDVQEKIKKSEERLKLSLWGSGDEMWDWDIKAGKIYRSNMWKSLNLGEQGDHISSGTRNIHPDDIERVNSTLISHFEGKSEHFEAAYRVKNNEGNWVWLLDRAKVVERDSADRPARMTGTIKDITKSKASEDRLSLFEKALTNISEGMFILDENYNFIEVNDACKQISGYSREELIGREIWFSEYPDTFLANLKLLLEKQGRWNDEIAFRKANGESIDMELNIDRLFDQHTHSCFYVGVFSDITMRKQADSELRRLANNDGLTGLPNRNYFQVHIDNLIEQSKPFCLMLFDLDNFKRVNDSLGHGAGDQLLCHVASRLKGKLPKQSILHRLGGDEFAIVFEEDIQIARSARRAEAVLKTFEQPYTIEHQQHYISASMGLVHFPDDDNNTQSLLRKADLAMYHAKSQGGNRYQFFSEELNKQAMSRMNLEGLMRQGLKENWYEIHYQPKVNGDSYAICGMEALVRLRHPEQGLISPAQFIPLAEESNLIIEIGELVLKQACFTTKKLLDEGYFEGRVAVNLSSKQLNMPNLPEQVERILELTQLPAHHLELEITESAVIEQPERAKETLLELQNLGVSLALDDFGTGYSSLAYLKQLPLNTLKIDKSFVDDISTSLEDKSMVDSIITIARNLGLTVVAEGVEHESQVTVLQQLHCEMIQGFLFSKPVQESELHKLVHDKIITPEGKRQEIVI
ncbi:EAL domain-containing protein [uncultured Ferrimonas sp.]|uniref:EAL domain-containing protein n=1 Tax=uncultured Ferrimonas sp. TaxID=432640 RepID=UPI002617BE99|nr:EAL domain-containing protein [uncultured Ferrimonas sp.]